MSGGVKKRKKQVFMMVPNGPRTLSLPFQSPEHGNSKCFLSLEFMNRSPLRKTSNMEDSSAMTIEFLRARLLSERSISRSARQRADELAEKVIELEEQLRMVTLQRRMAEKATADVLAILEYQGVSDVSGEFDSGSDHEITCDSSVCNDSAKAGERSMISKVRRHGSDELSGSKVNSSPASGRSLSWKGRLDSSRSLEKYMTSSVRRRSSFSSISSSPRHRQGKSCRRIEHRETRSVVEDTKDSVICQENDCNGGPNILRVESETREEDDSALKLANKNHDADGCEREDMEKAIEHQAKLIDKYEAMEKVQRDWEEKFRENNTITPYSFDMGTHSDITEERDESKAQIPCSARETTSSAQQNRLEASAVYLSEEMINAGPGDKMPKSGYNDQNSVTVSTSGIVQEISHSQLKGNQNESQENCHSQPSDRHHRGPCKHDFPNSKPADSSSSGDYCGLPLNDAPRDKNGPSERGFHDQLHAFSVVLESLKQARLSLQEKINKLPLVESGYAGKAINPLAPACKSEHRYDIPVGCSGLFRVPTDFSDQATARFITHDSTSELSSKFYLGTGISRTLGVHVGTSPYCDTMFSADNPSLATRYSGTLSRSDIRSDPCVPSVPSDKQMYRTHPFLTTHQNATPQISLGEGLSRPYSSSIVGVPPAHNFSFHSDHVRSNMQI